MSFFPKGAFPGAGFGAYLAQEQKKYEGKVATREADKYTFICHEIDTQDILKQLTQIIVDHLGGYPGEFTYRGKLDGRIPRSYPSPAKEGNFWVVEYGGHIGNSDVIPGDIIVRMTEFMSDWELISGHSLQGDPVPQLIDHSIRTSLLRSDLMNKQPPQPKPQATKAAPGPHKRKIILEDE